MIMDLFTLDLMEVDFVTWGLIFGAALLILATLWNILFAAKEKKIPSKFFQYFMKKYGFTTNDEAKLYNGFFENRAVQLKAEPPSAIIQVANPRGVHLVFMKGREKDFADLSEVNFKGLEDAVILSNYPLLVEQVLDEDLLQKLNLEKNYFFEFKKGLVVEIPLRTKAESFENILHLGIQIAENVERLNYLR